MTEWTCNNQDDCSAAWDECGGDLCNCIDGECIQRSTTTTTTTITTPRSSITTTVAVGEGCMDPLEAFEGAKFENCTNWHESAACFMSCAADYQSTGKRKTKILCKCEENVCTWQQKVEFVCEGPCRAFQKESSRPFRVLKDYSTSGTFGTATNSVLVKLKVRSMATTDDWTFLVRFAQEMTDLEVKAVELDTEWNCRKNILYLRPLDHNRSMSPDGGPQAFWTQLLFIGITAQELHNALPSDSKNFLWFESAISRTEGNCHHYDFEYDAEFCPTD